MKLSKNLLINKCKVLQFIKVCAGCHVLEGYGATETGGACGKKIYDKILGNLN